MYSNCCIPKCFRSLRIQQYQTTVYVTLLIKELDMKQHFWIYARAGNPQGASGANLINVTEK